MKNLLILFSIVLLAAASLTAQSVPAGMRFQAIARGLNGDLLTQKSLVVQVELFSNDQGETVHYAETHKVRSNRMGLLDFIIGEGNHIKGAFGDIPWTTAEMWVRIAIKAQGDKHFQIISAGQLYTVPYAMYAEKAGEIKVAHDSRTPNVGMNSINWTLTGNYNSQQRNNGNPVLGTTDNNDLVFVTNNIPRIIIDADGNINFLVDLDFNGNLNVDGTTTLNDDLTVTGMSSTSLSGTLAVDKATSLHAALEVLNMAPTHLTGDLDVDKTMNVDGATTLNSSLQVTGAKATHLTGTMTTDGTTTLNDDLNVANMAPASLTGDLDVDGAMNVDGATTLNSALNVAGEDATTLTGTLTVDKTTTLNDALTVDNAAPTHLTGDLEVDGAISAGTITVDAALTVDGMNPTHLTGILTVDKLATMESGMTVSGGNSVGPGNEYLAFFENQEGGASDGVAIRLDADDVNREHNFMTFYKSGSTVAGRIEGYAIGDMADIPVPTSDEIWTAACIGIADYNPITIMWTQMANNFNAFSTVWNATTIPSFDIPDIPAFTITDVPALAIPDVPAFVITDVPGFSIPDIPGFVTTDIPGLSIGPLLCTPAACLCPCDILDPLNFNCCCVPEICLIPTSFEVWPSINIPDFPGLAIPDFPGIPIPDFPGIPVPDFPGIPIPDFPGLVIPAVPELDFSEVIGECPTLPTFSDLLIAEGICPNEDLFAIPDGYLARLANWAYQNRLHNLIGLDPVKILGNALAWGLTTAVMHDGVVYGSKGADYAEYLPKMYNNEVFLKGEVVGVHNGVISKNTQGADQILAITSQPLVLGNMPEAGEEASFEKVAFLGQIPVFVQGPVAVGDYILPSGKNDGVAVAVKKETVTADMLSLILGSAWSSYEGKSVTLINTSIGLRPMEIAEVMKKQSQLEASLDEQVKAQRNSSDELTSDILQLKQTLGIRVAN